MRTNFERYLINNGYKTVTPNDRPSTVYDYIKRVDSVCRWEQLTWEGLAGNIPMIISMYDMGGAKQHLGEKSHRAVINALRRFSEFLNTY